MIMLLPRSFACSGEFFCLLVIGLLGPLQKFSQRILGVRDKGALVLPQV
jgi:hypothetical protein